MQLKGITFKHIFELQLLVVCHKRYEKCDCRKPQLQAIYRRSADLLYPAAKLIMFQ